MVVMIATVESRVNRVTERFGHLLAKHRPWLLRQAQRMTAGAPEADDLVQDVLVKFTIHFRDRDIPEESGCVAWMTTTLKNGFITTLRKAHVEEKASSDPTLPPSIASEGDLEDAVPFYESVTDEQLARAVTMLSSKQREVFEAAGAGKRYAVIAEELGISINAVAKRLFDARMRLRKLLRAGHRKGGC
jgi:RNA polymerase sigma-70 factor, ECF subfamily